MGTRALISMGVVYDGDQRTETASIYVHSDGYPSGLGRKLAEFLDGMTIVSGLSSGQPAKVANGPGCLFAQLVASLKNDHGVGGIYLQPPGQDLDNISYAYHVDVQGVSVRLGVSTRDYETGGHKTLVDAASVPEFLSWLNTVED